LLGRGIASGTAARDQLPAAKTFKGLIPENRLCFFDVPKQRAALTASTNNVKEIVVLRDEESRRLLMNL
jgi:hypothetical protein